MAFKNKNQNQNQQAPNNQPPPSKPVANFRSGVLSVSVWEQDGSNGTFYRANAQRAFKREGAEDWEHTDSFGRDDMLIVAELMRTAWAWIMRKESEAKR